MRRGDLAAIKLGGRGQWRIERVKLEEYLARAYEETQRQLARPEEADDEGTRGSVPRPPAPGLVTPEVPG